MLYCIFLRAILLPSSVRGVGSNSPSRLYPQMRASAQQLLTRKPPRPAQLALPSFKKIKRKKNSKKNLLQSQVLDSRKNPPSEKKNSERCEMNGYD
jgi:hypothetical protein